MADEKIVNYTTEEKPKLKYFSVGDLRKAIAEVADDAPVVAAPLNDKVRVALDLSIAEDGKLGDYEGNVVVFSTGLFDIPSGKRILLSPEDEKDEQGNN